jgi:ketosteroid isomerase-like protein
MDRTATTTGTSAGDVVTAFFAALASGDMVNATAHLADEVTWHIPGRSSVAGTYTGPDGVVSFFERWAPFGRRLDTTFDGIVADDHTAVVRMTSRCTEPDRPLRSRECHVFEVHEGRITTMTEYQADQHGFDQWVEA